MKKLRIKISDFKHGSKISYLYFKITLLPFKVLKNGKNIEDV